jgi:hypothetical protein
LEQPAFEKLNEWHDWAAVPGCRRDDDGLLAGFEAAAADGVAFFATSLLVASMAYFTVMV